MNWNLSLFIFCSLTGLVLVVGSLYLVWKGIIYLDRENNSASELEMPGGFKVKTPVPALVMFVLGVFLVVFPVYKNPELCPDMSLHKKHLPEMVRLSGKVAAGEDVEVYAIVDAQKSNVSDNVVLSVPYMQDHRYVVRYKVGTLTSDEAFRLEQGEKVHELQGVKINGKPEAAPQQQRMGLEHVEPENAVAEFKQ